MATVITDIPETIADWLDRGVAVSRHQWRRRKYWRETLAQSEALQARLEESRDQYLINCVKRLYTHPYFAFEPRPDNPANGDQQTGFLESQAFTTVALGGTGCLGGEEQIFDPANGFRRLDKIDCDFCVLARRPDTGEIVRTKAVKPWIKGVASLYRWTLSTGESFVATENHRVVASSGKWITLGCAWREKAPLLSQKSAGESHAADITHKHVAINQTATVESVFASTHPMYFEQVRTDVSWVSGKEWIRASEFYDFEVPGFGNYVHAGLVNANSGKSYIGSQRCIKFLCEDQPPPIKDTPFFVIADNLEEASKACWAQKLYDHIPHEWVDWERITWRSEKMNFPKIVPLRPWNSDSGNNWAIYFCGYTQDRKAFQAIAAGGAWFTEQFPYDIYEEVVGRMRQWMYTGAIWLEFTPLDPTDSVKVQDLYERWTRGELDESQWSFHRLNTEEAAKSGHIKKEFVDALKATISPEMLATRLRGDFGSYEGVIYQSFNPLVHFIPGTQFERCPDDINLTYKRSIDWGAGPHNAFCVLWGVKDTMGRWFILDEYYTTDQTHTWEDHVREIHKKDGWNLVCEISRGIPRYHLEPIAGMPQRWRYDRSNFGQTYAPPEQPDLFREFAKYCLPVTPAKNSFQSGVDCVRTHLKFNDMTREQLTEPRLFIDRKRCPNLARELPALQWKVPPKNAVNPHDPKMEQKKINDHSPDALRYLLYSDWQGNTGNLTAFKVESPVRPQIRFKR